MRPIPVLALILALAVPVLAAPPELSKEDRALLDRQKILVAGKDHWSVSSVYKTPGLPLFITTDSVLAVYHSLLREATARMEWSRGQALGRALLAMWAALPDAARRFDLDEATIAAARRRCRIVLATARILLGEDPDGSREVLETARAEAARIEAAAGVESLPAWYGQPSPGFAAIDYTRFQPTGVLAEVPDTARVARVASWLAFVPFRIDRDDELVSFLMLVAAAENAEGAAEAFGHVEAILGTPEDPCLASAPTVPQKVRAATLERLRQKLLETARPPVVRDPPTLPGHSGTISARILPLATTPDGVLLQRISDGQSAAGAPGLPSALAIAAALGSVEAARSLSERDRAIIAATREAGFAPGPSLHDRYLRCLSRLLEPPPDEAPDLFRGEAWRTKSLQTALAGFTFWRQAWDLRVKDGMRYFGLERVPPGFVEPNPIFFRELAGIVAATGKCVDCPSTTGLSYRAVVAAATCEAAARAFASVEPMSGEGEGEISDEAWDAYKERIGVAMWTEPLVDRAGASGWYAYVIEPMRSALDGDRGPRSEKQRDDVVRWLRDKADEIRSGEIRRWERLGLVEDRLAGRFTELSELLKELARLATKQLAGTPFSEEEGKWIESYGRTIGPLMGEGDNPSDDAPAAVSVFSDPTTGRHLVEAVSRPRMLFVLYPFGGQEILCRGAVIPWFELSMPRAPTDQEWKAGLDSDRPPELPPVTRTIYAQ